MVSFPIHTLESAPQGSRDLLQGLQDSLSIIPNLAATMAESPELLKGFLSARQILYSGTFTPVEVQVLALTNAFENSCEYCMAFHSYLALKSGASQESVSALRAGRSPLDPRLKALSDFSRALVQRRGQVTQDDMAAMIGAGYTRAQLLETVLGVAVSILPNFAHHLTRCPLDETFRSQQWTASSRESEAAWSTNA